MIYKPGLENKAADALSRMPKTVHLNHLTAPALIDLSIIKEEVMNDPRLSEIITELEKDEGSVSEFTVQKGRLVISKTSTLLPTILHTYHVSVFGGHSGFLRTYKRLMGELYFEGMKRAVKKKKYCDECLICQRNKTLALSPAGLLMPLEIPEAVWRDIYGLH